jgi:hypothetical protein
MAQNMVDYPPLYTLAINRTHFMSSISNLGSQNEPFLSQENTVLQRSPEATQCISLKSKFAILPNELIQNHIGYYLTPSETLTARLVSKRFAILFGDDHVWHKYYKAYDLAIPKTSSNPNNDSISCCKEPAVNINIASGLIFFKKLRSSGSR